MAMRNASGDEKHLTYDQLYCSPQDFTKIRRELISLSVLNVFLSISAFLGNTLIQVALYNKPSSLHPPTKLLLRTLSATDLCVGLISEPLVVTYWLPVVNKEWNICRYALSSTFIVGYILGPVSLLTLTAISMDRLLALSLGLGYRDVVTLKRISLIVITFWVVSSIAATLYLWDYHIPLWYGNIVISLCLVTSVFSYTKIYLKLRHHQIQIQDQFHHHQSSQERPLNIARFRKAVSSALWLQFTLVVCYLPAAVVGAMWTNSKFSSSLYLSRQLASTFVFLNSSLNPILYCWRIAEIRQAVKDTVRQICDSSANIDAL